MTNPTKEDWNRMGDCMPKELGLLFAISAAVTLLAPVVACVEFSPILFDQELVLPKYLAGRILIYVAVAVLLGSGEALILESVGRKRATDKLWPVPASLGCGAIVAGLLLGAAFALATQLPFTPPQGRGESFHAVHVGFGFLALLFIAAASTTTTLGLYWIFVWRRNLDERRRAESLPVKIAQLDDAELGDHLSKRSAASGG